MKMYKKLFRTLLCIMIGFTSSYTFAADEAGKEASSEGLIERTKTGESGIQFVIRYPEKVEKDKSVFIDFDELIVETDKMLSRFRERTGTQTDKLPAVQISWMTKGRTIQRDPESPPPEGTEREFNDEVIDGYETYGSSIAVRSDSFSAYKPQSRNEFNLYIPAELRDILLNDAMETGSSDSYTGRESAESNEAVENNQAHDKLIPLGWSMNDDNRVRLGSLNTQMNTWPWRAITHFNYGGSNSGCSGSMIGPRHIVTAAHCINKSKTNDFFSFTVSTRRNGTAFQAQTSMPGCPDLNCPSIGKTYWYFTPSPWRQENTSNREQYDIGIIVIPDRLGDSTGWMGYWYAPINSLNTVNKYSRGYPSCNASSNGSPRIDDPADPLKCPTCTTDLTQCDANHLYGDAASCSIGNATNVDGSGYNRNFRMSCDGSAAMSGSPLYFYGNGFVGSNGSVYYTAHDIQWTCGGLASSDSCANVTRADRLLRLTPEYAGWISYFRNQFP